ncbi:MAG: aminoglycoside phosphotransferase family protein [Acidimicrobiales bacterium]
MTALSPHSTDEGRSEPAGAGQPGTATQAPEVEVVTSPAERVGLADGLADALSSHRVRRFLGPILRAISPVLRRWRSRRGGQSHRHAVDSDQIHPLLADIMTARYGAEADDVEVRLAHTVNDAIVAVIEHHRHAEVLKVALSASAAAEFTSQDQVIRALFREPRLAGWRDLIPTSTPVTRIPSGAVVESLLPGVSLRDAIAHGDITVGGAATLALDAIVPFHQAISEHVTVREHHLADWIDEPLAVLRDRLGDDERTVAALAQLRAELRDGLVGRTLSVGWVHGDYTAGNVLIDPTVPEVTGVVDWARGRPGLPCVLDEVLLLISLWCEDRGVEFGVYVESRLDHDDDRLRRILGNRDPGAILPGDRTLLLFGWLRHVADNLDKSARYARSPIWLANNVDPVLAAFEPRSAPPLSAEPATEPAADRRGFLARRAPELTLVGVMALWLTSLSGVRLDRMNDFGLVSVLPVTFWIGLAALTVTYALTVGASRSHSWRNVAFLVLLIAMLHATPSILYGTLRYSWAWKHIGVVEFIARTHHVDPNVGALSAYQAWPGFFTMNAAASGAAGFKSALSYASWAPLVFNLLNLGPLMLILRSLTDDRRLRWWSLWVFSLGSWVGQDYFSPQAFNYFLYLCILAVCLKWLRRDRPDADAIAVEDAAAVETADATEADPVARPALLAMCVLAIGAIATSHQLTPFMLIAALGALWLLRLARTRLLLVAGVVLTVGWLLYSGSSFLTSNLYWIIDSIGRPLDNAGDNFINLASASKGQATVALIDRALSAGIWGLAAIGVWRRGLPIRRGARTSDRAALVLALSPVPLLVANSYGGEMLFRVYLFALPFVSFFAAAAIFPTVRAGRHALSRIAAVTVAVALMAGFVFAYYGKEHINYFSPQEVSASEWVYDNAPRGALIMGATSNLPWAFRNYEQYEYEWFALESPASRRASERDAVRELGRLATASKAKEAYVILTKSQAAEIDSSGVMRRGSIGRIERQLDGSSRFVPVFRGSDAVVYRWEAR